LPMLCPGVGQPSGDPEIFDLLAVFLMGRYGGTSDRDKVVHKHIPPVLCIQIANIVSP